MGFQLTKRAIKSSFVFFKIICYNIIRNNIQDLFGKRILSIGDNIGQPDKLEKLLKRVKYDSFSNDFVNSIRDYVDRCFKKILKV